MVLLYIALAAVFLIVFAYVFRKKTDEEKGAVVPYLLDDANFARNEDGSNKDLRIEKWCYQGGRYLGNAVFAFPREAEIGSINITTPPGGTNGIYISLLFQLGKWEWLGRMKVDEWIEVSPTFAQYYQITLRQKEEMETRIKQGLASAAQAVSDLELLKHDLRKYREFLEYFGLAYDSETRKWAVTGDKDGHALRAMFIDMVDAHTGEGIAIRSIVQRWPTLIVDFQRLGDEDIDVDKIKDKLGVSKAEAVVLSTKNRLYVQWKRLFEPEIKARTERLTELVRSREESVKQYRDWLKPVIARHKMLAEGLEDKGRRANLKYGTMGFLFPPGVSNAYSSVKVWAWHWLTLQELEKGGTERLAIEQEEGGKKYPTLPGDDAWTKRELIFHKKHGLIVKYPWITEEWVDENIQTIWDNGWLLRQKLYYSFVIIEFLRGNMRSASGEEVEDSVFAVNCGMFSRNVMLVKLLELLAMREDFNRYVDNLLGVKHEVPLPEEGKYQKATGEKKRYEEGGMTEEERKKYEEKQKRKETMGKIMSVPMDFLGFFTMGRFRFMKRGPYERDFAERLTKYWFRTASQTRYDPVVRFIKDKIGMGVN